MTTILFLVLRALHVLVAGVWIGSTVFVSKMLAPAIDRSGPAGGQVMMRLNRVLTPFMAVFATTTVASGAYLLWHFTGGFDVAVLTTHAGIAFGTGGAAGILAGVIGGAVVGRSAVRVGTIMGEAATLPEGAAKGALLKRAASIRHRMERGSSVVLALQTIALVLMAVGHYV